MTYPPSLWRAGGLARRPSGGFIRRFFGGMARLTPNLLP